MNENITLNEVVARFLTLSVSQKQLFLATYASELTILARGHFLDKDYELARQCNESIHRITGHIASLARRPEAAPDESFIDMIVKSAAQKGWGDLVLRSLK